MKARLRVVATCLVVATCSIISTSSLSALSVSSKPSAPLVRVIESKKNATSKTVSVIVTFQLASTHSKSPLQMTEVKVGNYICRAIKKTSKCVIKNVPSGKTYKVSARAKNRNGYGSWSSAVSYRTRVGNTWRRPISVSPTIPSPTSTIPAADLNVSSELKFNISSASALAMVEPGVQTASVRKFSTGSNLVTLDSSGNRSDAVIGGKAQISRFLIAPNDKLYVVFKTAVAIDSSDCILAEIEKSTGKPVCVEKDKDFKFISAGQSEKKATSAADGFRNLVNPFQFDSEGSIYYLGIPGTKESFPNKYCCTSWEGEAGSVVRRYRNGVTKDFGLSKLEVGREVEPGWAGTMANEIIIRNPIYNFLVLSDGTILIDQGFPHVALNTTPTTYCKNARLDKWSPEGVRTAVLFADSSNSLRTDCRGGLPSSDLATDAAMISRGAFGFMQFLDVTTLGVGDSGKLYSVNVSNATASRLPYLHYPTRFPGCTNSIDSRLVDFEHYFCGGATMWRASWRTPIGATFAIVGQDPVPNSFLLSLKKGESWSQYERIGIEFGSGVLSRVWPTQSITRVGSGLGADDIVRTEAFLPILDSVVVAGPGVDGRPKTALYNTENETLTTLISADEGIRVTKLGFNAGLNQVFFSGMRVSNKTQVLGYMNLQTRALTVTSVDSTVTDLQAFTR